MTKRLRPADERATVASVTTPMRRPLALVATLVVATLGAAFALPLRAPAPAAAAPAAPGDYVSVSEGRELTAGVRDAAFAAAGDLGAGASLVYGSTLGLLSLSRGGAVLQAPPPGWRIPMTSIAIDPGGAGATMSGSVSAALAAGQVVMGSTTATLRGAQAGDTLVIQTGDGAAHTLTLGLVAPDIEVGFIELVFPRATADAIGFSRPSSVRIYGFADRDAVAPAVNARLAAAGLSASINRSWIPGGVDSTLPQSTTKALLGEFAVTGGPDPLTVEQSWYDANIGNVPLPIIGTIRCHRTVAVDLAGALNEIQAAGLAGYIDVADTRRYGGCYYPREVRPNGSTTGGSISRHTWGMALDVNPSTNAMGDPTPSIDQRIVDIFRRWGFAWGGSFTIPDGMHFEWVGGARRREYQVVVAGQPGVPANATAAVLNVTATETAADGYLTVYPCGETRPTASNVNYRRGESVPNLVVAKLGAGGKVCLYTYAPADVIIDLAGTFTPDSGYQPASPNRMLDTRTGAPVAAGTAVELTVAPNGAVPADAAAVALNVTATEAAGWGYLTVYPCDEPRPEASNVNYDPGQTIPNLVLAKVGAGGKVCIYSHADTHVVVDLAGWFAPGSDYVPTAPTRLLDTRPGGAPVPAGQSVGVAVPPAGAVLSVVATEPQAPGYLTVYACDQGVPYASNVNYVAGQTIANATIGRPGADGRVCVYTYATTHVVVDTTGSFATGAGYHPVTPARILDTRTDPARVLAQALATAEPGRPVMVDPAAVEAPDAAMG